MKMDTSLWTAIVKGPYVHKVSDVFKLLRKLVHKCFEKSYNALNVVLQMCVMEQIAYYILFDLLCF